MESRFGQHRLASKQRFRHLARKLNGPSVVSIGCIAERDQKPCIGNGFHVLEKPLRIERSGAFETWPASRIKGRSPAVRSFSNKSRMILPCDTPISLAVVSSHRARSSDKRTVIVLLTRQ